MLTFDTSGIERMTRKLERFRLAIPEIAGREVVRQVREFAASGKSPDGSDWKPYAPAYKARRQKMGLSTSPVNKRVTGAFLASVKLRDGVVAPDAANMPKAQGMEKKRKSFEVSPITPANVERLLLAEFNATS